MVLHELSHLQLVPGRVFHYVRPRKATPGHHPLSRMEAFLPDTVKAILLGVIAFALGWLARAHPDIAWLQVFRLPWLRLSEEEKARRRRAANRLAGLEIIVAGLVLPLLNVFSAGMMFNDLKPIPTFIVGTCSVLLTGLGIWVLIRNRYRQ